MRIKKPRTTSEMGAEATFFHFAWIPVRLTDGTWIWFEQYKVHASMDEWGWLPMKVYQ